MDDKLQKILKKIQALRARAECSASSEAEAEMAAKMAAKLLQEHNISLTELDVKAEGVDKYTWESGYAKMPPEAYALRGINKLCNVQTWFTGGRITIIGAPADSELALYYLDIVKAAINSCWETHKATEDFLWNQLTDETGRGYTIAFKKGVASRLGERMKAMATQVETQTTSNTLVVVKDALVRSWMQDHNINLRSTTSSMSSASGYSAGRSAANNVSISKGIGVKRSGQNYLA